MTEEPNLPDKTDSQPSANLVKAEILEPWYQVFTYANRTCAAVLSLIFGAAAGALVVFFIERVLSTRLPAIVTTLIYVTTCLSVILYALEDVIGNVWTS